MFIISISDTFNLIELFLILSHSDQGLILVLAALEQ